MLKEESVVPVIKVGGRGRRAHFTLCDESSIGEVERQIRRYFDESGGFFLGAQVSVDVGRRMGNPDEIERIRTVLEREYFLEVSEWRTTFEGMESGLTEYMGATTLILPPETAPSRERTPACTGHMPCGHGPAP